MPKQALLAIALTVLMLPMIVEGADLSGSLLYDDQPVAEVFLDIGQALATAFPSAGGPQINGTVDLAASTYRIEGLAAEEYNVQIQLFRTIPSPWLGYPGDLLGNDNVEPGDPGNSIELDLDVRYHYHVVSPVDSVSQLDGLRYDCTDHPVVPYPINFAIEPIPRATNYTFHAALLTCPRAIAGHIYSNSVDPFVLIEWGTLDEDIQTLEVTCTGASGKPLCANPSYRYNDGGAWALALTHDGSSIRGVHRTDATVIPAVAGTPGANGTYWSSAVSVVNLATTDREIEVLYTPRGADGLMTYSSESVLVPASSQRSWTDIVAELFSTTGAGALEFRGLQLAVTSRTSTPDAESGSYGQGIPPIHPAQALSAKGTDSAAMGGVEEGVTFRTNLGLCEIWGESITVRVSIMDSSMSELGHRDYELRPYENIQVNQVALVVGGADSLSNGIVRVTVTSGDGRVGAYLSLVDNATGDPTFITVAAQSPSGG
jgi:hypothetical protein